MSNENLTKRQIFYQAHKDDEEFMNHNRELRRASYYRRQEKEKADALARYYKRKEALAAVVTGQIAPAVEIPDQG